MSRSGNLKRRIEIKRPSTVTDELGGQEVSYTSIGFFWAEVRRLNGSRGLENQQTTHGRPFSITIRQDIDILENDTVEFNSQVLIVSSVERDFDKFKYQTLTANAKYSG